MNEIPDQRWMRPVDLEPGALKLLLATRHLNVAAKGNVEGLRSLLREHPEFINKRGPHNRTLLWEATRKGRVEAVEFLLAEGADLDIPACYNNETRVMVTPYCAARYYGRDKLATYLWSKGSKLDVFRAAFLGDRPRVAARLRSKPERIDLEDPHDNIYFTPLLAFAVAGGHTGLIKSLIDRGAAVGCYSAQLLNLAGRNSRLDLIEILLANGADIRAVDSSILTDIRDLEIFEYLLDHGAPVNQVGYGAFPPLVYVVRGDKGERVDKVRALLERGAKVNSPGPKSRTALHYAAAAGFLQVLELLLDHGADPKIRDEAGNSALKLAQENGRTSSVDLLLRYGVKN